ncbi:MAG: ABC transporter permease [Chitinophagales bacterium]|nr:ABC transporter permease [Chitinophagales bacterium]
MINSKQKENVFSKRIDQSFKDLDRAFKFVGRFFKELFQSPFEFREIIQQCYEVGYKSLPLITLTGFVTGIVFTKQSRPSLADFGASSWLPSLIAIALVRTLAPLVTALIAAGKVGSNIGAELGSMKVTEQIDAMEVSAINPYKYLVVTRVFATTFMVPVLMFYCAFVGLMGAYLNVHANELTSFVAFFKRSFESITFLDVFSSLFKSIVYGFTIGIVGCYQGFNATQGTQGVGRAANASVVLSMFLIFIEEILIVQVTNWIRFY